MVAKYLYVRTSRYLWVYLKAFRQCSCSFSQAIYG